MNDGGMIKRLKTWARDLKRDVMPSGSPLATPACLGMQS
jgi:hypothetical protein